MSIAVIAVLLAILAPSLSGVRETTRRVVCSSNVRQIGLGLAMYRDMYQDKLPDSRFAIKAGISNSEVAPQQMMILRITDFHDWDGLGYLYAHDFLNAPGVFYCPSHHGHYPAANYSEAFASGVGEIHGNFQYRGDPRWAVSTAPASAASDGPSAALLSDGMATRLDFNHIFGANVLRRDLAVTWFADTNRALYYSLSETLVEGQIDGNVTRAWQTLDGSNGGN